MVLRALVLLALVVQLSGCARDSNRNIEEEKIEHRHQDQMIRMG